MQFEEKTAERFERLLPLLLITLVGVVAYGFMIPRLGFYRDDWYMLWTAQAQGTKGLLNLFAIDRPFIGYLYAFDYTILGAHPLNWHLYALAVKMLGGFSFYWLLRLLWPQKRAAGIFATILFIVYPGFYQQPNAALFINLLTSQTAAMLSLALTVYAVQVSRRWMGVFSTLAAVVLALFYLIIYEAMLGLELARLALLAYGIYRLDTASAWKSRITSLLKWAWPYLALTAGFTYWRIFLFESGRRSTSVNILWEQFSRAPVHGVLAILIETAKDLFDTIVFAWSVPLYQNVSYSGYRELGESLVLAALAVGLVVLFLLWSRRRGQRDADLAQATGEYRHMLLLGALVVLVTTLPIVAAGRDASFSFQWDRYTVQSTLGVALVMAGLAFAYVRPPAREVFLLALLGSGVITQYQSAVYYRDLWTQEREMWWQLSWRAPDLQPGSEVIAAPPVGYRFLEEYEVWGPLNMIYNPGGPIKVGGQVPFDGIEENLASGFRHNRKMRSVQVVHDYSKPLVISKPTVNSCLHVIDGDRLELPYGEDPRVAAIAPYSQIDLVLTMSSPETLPLEVFGREPEHGWCYYYQKISLARQAEDWEAALEFAGEIERLGLTAADRSEWLPVIETYLNAGELENAARLSDSIRTDRDMRNALCDQLKATTTWPTATDPAAFSQLVCRP
jgi:hypothetical protein